jgi:hypothetical protein
MRTSGELLRLHTDAKLQELLVSPLVELDNILEKQDEELSINSTFKMYLLFFPLFNCSCRTREICYLCRKEIESYFSSKHNHHNCMRKECLQDCELTFAANCIKVH